MKYVKNVKNNKLFHKKNKPDLLMNHLQHFILVQIVGIIGNYERKN